MKGKIQLEIFPRSNNIVFSKKQRYFLAKKTGKKTLENN